MPEIKQFLLTLFLVVTRMKIFKTVVPKNHSWVHIDFEFLQYILIMYWLIFNFFSYFGQINSHVSNGIPFLDWTTLWYLYTVKKIKNYTRPSKCLLLIILSLVQTVHVSTTHTYLNEANYRICSLSSSTLFLMLQTCHS